MDRMNGFLPDRFVDMLTERIDQALGKTGEPAKPKGSVQPMKNAWQVGQAFSPAQPELH